MTNKNCQTA